MSFIKGQLPVMVLLGMVYAVQLQLIGLKVGLIIGMIAVSQVCAVSWLYPWLYCGDYCRAISIWRGLGTFTLIIGAFMVGQAVKVIFCSRYCWVIKLVYHHCG